MVDTICNTAPFPSSRIDMNDLLAGEVKLASPPQIYLRITRIIEDPTKTVHDAAQVISHDPGLAARLLRLVNSAFYGFPRQIGSISHAISLVGVKELRDLVLATVVIERFSHLPNKLMTMREFWRISVRGALLAKELGQILQGAQSLFLCGLLHEIGRLVIYARIPELARAALLLADAERLEETEAERRTYGFDHYQLGGELMRRWLLPEVVVSTIAHHGHHDRAGAFSRETAVVTLALTVSIKDVSVSQLSAMEGISGLMDVLGLNVESLSEAVEITDRKFESVYRLLMKP